METHTWKCCTCATTGEGNQPDECPTCGRWDIEPTEAGYRAALLGWERIQKRIEALTNQLDYGLDSYEINGDTITIKWEAPACRCGCSGYETHYRDIPIKYLWMSTEEIEADQASIKEAAERARAEAERQKKLKEAERDLQNARARAQTAAEDAAKALADAEKKLSALKGQP
jgi:hypothetical protein